jgi:hypothetical protein
MFSRIHLIAKSLSGSKWKNIEAETDYIIKRQQHAEAVFDDSTTTMFEKAKKEYAICIICISLTGFPELPSVLASMFYHFEPDNDFAIGCIPSACQGNVFNTRAPLLTV